MIFNEAIKMNSEISGKKKRPLCVFSRIVVSLGLQLLMFLIGLFLPEWDYGTYSRATFWYAFNNFILEFSMLFLPTIAVFLLIPVFLRGSLLEKTVALIISLFPAWLAVQGWQGIFYQPCYEN